MKKIILTLLLTSMLFLASCGGGGGTSDSAGKDPFRGGTVGVTLDFVEGTPPTEVYDGGDNPFSVSLVLKNEGEYFIAQNDVSVELTGFDPAQFATTPTELKKNPDGDLIATILDAEGNLIESPPAIVEFTGLNHESRITGSVLSFPIRADLCYKYGTVARSQLCVLEDILTPDGDELCTINENKKVSNSGAPVQVTELKETPRARDKIGFTFTVSHVGSGDVYEQGTGCREVTGGFEDKVFVKVDTGLSGLTCSGLTGGADETEGVITLYGNPKIVTCTQPIQEPRDFEFPVTIEMTYDYGEEKETQITVKKTE